MKYDDIFAILKSPHVELVVTLLSEMAVFCVNCIQLWSGGTVLYFCLKPWMMVNDAYINLFVLT